MPTDEHYDFIIVGSGPAGATLSSHLARTPAAPRILLLEAGGANPTPHILADRYTTLARGDGSNWNYTTTPQAQLNHRRIDYSRGRGLGGSSAINFAVWTKGPRDDYDEWARRVGDDAFGWASVRERFKRLESYDGSALAGAGYVRLKEGAHGVAGRVPVSFAQGREWGFDESLVAAESIRLQRNLDLNSGDPIGVGPVPATARNGVRATAKTAFLDDAPWNLVVKMEALVQRVLFDADKRAVGVALVGGQTYYASKEIILSAGALDTPKLLMLSGIGPLEQLTAHVIPPIVPLPSIGRHLADHPMLQLSLQLPPNTTPRPSLFSCAPALAAARAAFAATASGPLTSVYNNLILGFGKLAHLHTHPAFLALDPETKTHMSRPTVPHFELAALGPVLHPSARAENDYFPLFVFLMSPKSEGCVSLGSSDARDPPVCDPRLFEQEVDRVAVVLAVRAAMRLLQAPVLREFGVGVLSAPGGFEVGEGVADENVWEWVRENAGTSWHMCGTVRMGRAEEEVGGGEGGGIDGEGDANGTAVDNNFKVRGVKGLRVVDCSVLPFVLNCHLVSVAYLVGETAAEKIVVEYGLDLEGT
ncbi:GMC oxidoreductase [Aplosporella prunicola CBS 121167]|uniref:GMC oxidoreductase n=1 Tax=Aplosporella prunicola CBS 121167 TaxID=1176127 RepID=A0A6A6B7K3_9PEZI|nr:GMC oxidoreductase [Aplosporella prunicola CBS 121167]KAF2139235.1 GMC oxidoreductase [Aplosporella prunicola CBS 121167]